MKSSSVLRLILLLGLWILERLVAGQPKSFVGCATMCKGFTKELPLRLLKSYKKTDPSCPKSVIIFSTKKSREFCANPEESWVKVFINKAFQDYTFTAHNTKGYDGYFIISQILKEQMV
ncbi:fractalkine [Alligator mississippiensis]|uniref:Fractalkine n=1 Tax=Alligator mississippiensis TaxID=8496 RepID=A0A151MRK4_ALLMI|nr:fractalkine [Alligator mississippiensis]